MDLSGPGIDVKLKEKKKKDLSSKSIKNLNWAVVCFN
jgi:hypothetical protein